jgi:hypothetical protein
MKKQTVFQIHDEKFRGTLIHSILYIGILNVWTQVADVPVCRVPVCCIYTSKKRERLFFRLVGVSRALIYQRK